MRLTKFVLVCAVLLGFSGMAAAADTLLSEDFEGFSLKPYQSPTESGGDGTDWTDELPAGWAMTFSGPLGDPFEFQGWRIHDVDSWIATEGDQQRSTWTRGGVGQRGSVLLVDPDAYDDGTDIGAENMNTSVTTPPIDLSTVVPGTVSIAFDSFFRNEEPSDLSLDVSFDGGGSYSNLLYYESDNLGDGAVFDEQLQFSVNNPASGSLVFKFSLLNGDNDWWWAIDNVHVTGQLVPEPSSLGLLSCGLTALGLFRRRRGA
jgi:hypothetical protein